MGGIFGFVCKEALRASSIVSGLLRLVYRGYDGVGVAYLEGGKVGFRRRHGRTHEVIGYLGLDEISSSVVVGHTRYASRGAPSDANTHPLIDCSGRVAVVSDGVLYDYEAHRDRLSSRGHRMSSTTDTEVLAHMVEEGLSSGPLRAVLRAVGSIGGLYSAVFLVEGFNGALAVSRGQQLVVGESGGCYYVSSDLPSLHGYSSEALIVEDDTLVAVTPGGLEAYRIPEGVWVALRQRKRVKYVAEFVDKGGYPHYMLKEIYEIPKALHMTTATLLDKYLRLAAMIIHGARDVYVIGNGTSLHAGMVSQYYFAERSGTKVVVSSAAEFPYYALENVSTGTVVLAISQSGETSDVVRSVMMAKQRGAVIVGVTNVVGSRLTLQSNVYLPIGSGPELSVPATKTFTSTLAALAILATYTGLFTGKSSREDLGELYEGIRGLAKRLQESLEEIDLKARRAASLMAAWGQAYVASSGLNYPIALEGALKLKEASMIQAEGYQLGELRHGPIVLVSKGYPVILVEPVEEPAKALYRRIAEEISGRGGTLITIGSGPGDSVRPPEAAAMLTPISNVVPLQLIAYRLGRHKGLPIDTPPGLAKTVTT